MLTVVPEESDGRDGRVEPSVTAAIAGSSSLIDEIVREGARRMLAEALQAEVDAYSVSLLDRSYTVVFTGP